MKPIETLSKAKAKNLIIHSQLFPHAGSSSLDVIRQLGYVQIDTLAVAERAHHHIFHTRNTQYQKDELMEMLRGKQIFEYWSHAASYLPIEDYRYSLIRKQEFADGKSHWFRQNKKMIAYVLDRIKAEGPLQSKDFKDPSHNSGAWYKWKPAKVALEQLFMEGKLMVAERVNFQKVYDLTERILPAHVDTSMPSKQEFHEYLIIRTLTAQGIATLTEITYLRKGLKSHIEKALKKLISEGKVKAVSIEGIDQTYFVLAGQGAYETNNAAHILSPFDNLIIQRKRAQEIFDFNYQLECYVPEKKRKFGYYCLPILYKDQLVGKFDPKADRTTGIFTVKSFWLEANFEPDEDFTHAFAQSLGRFVSFCGCRKLKILKSRNNPVLKEIEKRVNSR
ncbi:YcaQ family DNA glycosylase [Fulvivirga sp. 29W222]|uniref:YcaQ family DNA glycosylase n=1 Tax=Fulvivirga marina TaxID=2494733 RepID=A0A937KE06_9BACT|nr:crosslink repair DNA glycosylase YcaQ family protein [Fulvivirga marina]MBL6446615.1 YcaQ family DNA glycosylase [Fulvivirga marina]